MSRLSANKSADGTAVSIDVRHFPKPGSVSSLKLSRQDALKLWGGLSAALDMDVPTCHHLAMNVTLEVEATADVKDLV